MHRKRLTMRLSKPGSCSRSAIDFADMVPGNSNTVRRIIAFLCFLCLASTDRSMAETYESLRKIIEGSWISEKTPHGEADPNRPRQFFTGEERTYRAEGTMSGFVITTPGIFHIMLREPFSGTWRIENGKLFITIVQPPEKQSRKKGEVVVETISSISQSQQVLRSKAGSSVTWTRRKAE